LLFSLFSLKLPIDIKPKIVSFENQNLFQEKKVNKNTPF